MEIYRADSVTFIDIHLPILALKANSELFETQHAIIKILNAFRSPLKFCLRPTAGCDMQFGNR